MLRSVLAQLDFSYQIRNYNDNLQVPFRHFLYVPEVHPITKVPICEREDEGHVLKVEYCCNKLIPPFDYLCILITCV